MNLCKTYLILAMVLTHICCKKNESVRANGISGDSMACTRSIPMNKASVKMCLEVKNPSAKHKEKLSQCGGQSSATCSLENLGGKCSQQDDEGAPTEMFIYMDGITSADLSVIRSTFCSKGVWHTPEESVPKEVPPTKSDTATTQTASSPKSCKGIPKACEKLYISGYDVGCNRNPTCTWCSEPTRCCLAPGVSALQTCKDLSSSQCSEVSGCSWE